MKDLRNIPECAISVTDDVVGLYPSIASEVGLNALRMALDNRKHKPINPEDLKQMEEFVFKKNFFKFNEKVKQQISGMAISNKFALTYVCIFMDRMETNFFNSQENATLVW